ncbi:hypothetical protein [Rhodoferax saidenbachensis]|uniref:Glycosyltransferase RgtA/B/C/D-like domain-containing protein n=1 Tax=Rhodoferax saidenbachensis TaxID=1484693 RepID=A0A1P8KEF3_9BURK|nr:hypothetical protein [Rhodoferax saidenbachensis]APW44328.1 hypothetical protein RS694_18570 [Rhodoferax saidenbachensis]
MPDHSRHEILVKYGLSLGVWPIAFFSLFLAMTGVSRALGTIAPLSTAALAFVAAAWVVRWTLQPPWRVLLTSAASVLLMALIAVVWATLWRDISFDGQAIHFPSALEILDGLNPVTTRPSMYFSAVYPNGLWTLQALFISLTSGFEEGKAPAWIIAFSSIPLITVALRTWHGAWTRKLVIAAVLVQVNPVMLLQLTTFELDGVVYSLAVIAVAGAMLLPTAYRRTGLVLVAGASLLLINTKITGLYWAGCIVATTLLQEWLSLRKLPTQLASTVLLTLAVSVVVVGWRPYATVPLETGKLFGASTEVVAAPANLREADPLTKMSFLLFGKSSNPVGAEVAELKWPWSLSASEFVSLFDIRIGGFGPGFGLLTLGALLVGVASTRQARRAWGQDNAWLGPFWTGVLVAATLLFPVSWWARLAAPFWLAVVLPLLWKSTPPTSKTPSALVIRAGWALALGGFIVTSVATVSTLQTVHATNNAISRVLDEVALQNAAVRIVPGNSLDQDQTPLIWQQRLIRASIFPRTGEATGCQQDLFPIGSVRLCIDRDRP